jgi:hypothetical protein
MLVLVDIGTDCDNGGDGDDAEEVVVGGDFIIVLQTVYLSGICIAVV